MTLFDFLVLWGWLYPSRKGDTVKHIRQAHPTGSLDREWFHRGPLPDAREWDRRDVDYDPIRPVEVLAMLPVAVLVFVAALCIVGFLLAVLAGPQYS